VVVPQRSISASGARVGGEHRLAGVARRQDGAQDAAALAGDLFVAGAGEPPAKLAAPIAGEDDVGVRVDEPGDHSAAARVDDRRARRQRDFVGKQALETDEDDTAVVTATAAPGILRASVCAGPRRGPDRRR
jgi:hypothetical protein